MSKKIKVLQVVSSMDRGGVETFLMNVLRNIDRNRFEFIFLCYGNRKFDYEDEIEKLGATIVRLPSAYNIFKIRNVIKNYGIDIVHSHTLFGSIYSIVAAYSSGVSVRIAHSHNTKTEAHSSIIKRMYFMLSRIILNKLSTHRFACGNDAGRALFGRKGFKIIYNGIELDSFAYNAVNREDIRKEFKVEADTTLLGHVGRFDEAKNHIFLLDVFYEYHAKNINSKLILIGDGVLRREIELKINDLGLSSQVILLGKRSDVNKVFCALDIFILPSLFEGLGIVLIEAQSSGLPCIASTEVPVEAKLLDTFEFISLESGAKEWAKKLQKINTSRRAGYKKNNFKNYDIANTVREITKVYEKVI